MLKQTTATVAPRKNAMRDKVAAVRSALSNSSELQREQIELALLYFELNVDVTVEAFKKNGAREALSGWTEMNNGRGHVSAKRTGGAGNNNNNPKSRNRNNKPTQQSSSTRVPPSNGVLRPSQRVSNIFQTFAEGGVPTITTNGNTVMSTSAYSPSSMSSSSFADHTSSVSSSTTNNNLQSHVSNDLLFHPYLSTDSTTTNDSQPLLNVQSNQNEFDDASDDISSHPVNQATNEVNDDVIIEDTNATVRNGKPSARRRKSTRNRNGSTSSITQLPEATTTSDTQQSTTTNNSSVSVPSSVPISPSKVATFSNNKKVLAKSAKDLQRQTSTLSNVQNSFDNEIKSSLKRIDDVFKQLRESLKEREVELYLEMDKVKEQGLNIIHHRQHRAVELRSRIDRCERLEPSEIDHLRTDIKQFVTDRRYDLGEELTSSHRFDFDQSLIEALKNFGHVLRIDRKNDRARTTSSSSALGETLNTTDTSHNDSANLSKSTPETSHEKPTTNGRIPPMSSSSNEQSGMVNEVVLNNNHNETDNHQQQQQPLPQRTPNANKQNGNRQQQQQSNGGKQNGYPQGWTNGVAAGDYHSNYYGGMPQTNGYYNQHQNPDQMVQQHYDDSYQTVNRRRPPYPQRNDSSSQFRGPLPPQYHNGNYPASPTGYRNSPSANTNGGPRRTRPNPPSNAGPNQRRGGNNNKQTNGTNTSHDNSETTNTYRRPRPAPPANAPAQAISN